MKNTQKKAQKCGVVRFFACLLSPLLQRWGVGGRCCVMRKEALGQDGCAPFFILSQGRITWLLRFRSAKGILQVLQGV